VNSHTAPTVHWPGLHEAASRSSCSDQQAGPPLTSVFYFIQ
jgi:hypothetical protein